MTTETRLLHFNTVDASLFVWSKLWSLQSLQEHYVSFNIFDVLILVDGNPIVWLFTTKEGEVKSRSKKNRSTERITHLWGERHVYIEEKALPFNAMMLNDVHTGKCMELLQRFQTSDILDKININKHDTHKTPSLLKVEKVEDFTAFMQREERLKIFLSPPASSSNSVVSDSNQRYLKVECVQGNIGLDNVKCFLLADSSLSGYAMPPSLSSSTTSSYKELPCRNKSVIALVREFCERLVKILSRGAEDSLRIRKFSMIILLQNFTNTNASASGPTIWLHHVSEIIFYDCNLSRDPSSGRTNPHLAGSVMSNVSSISNFSKSRKQPFSRCLGDFCGYQLQQDDRSNTSSRNDHLSHVDSILEMIFDDGDIHRESHRAIQRHKRTNDSSFDIANDSDQLKLPRASSDDDQDTDNIPQPVDAGEDMIRSQSDSSLLSKSRQLLKHKHHRDRRNKIVYKTICVTREEMAELSRIDQQLMTLFQPVNFDEIIQLRKSIEEVWPLDIARYYYNVLKDQSPSHFNRSDVSEATTLASFGSVGKLPSVLQRQLQLLQQSRSDDSESAAGGVEENKWFSHYFSSVEVCESCYLVYQQLEIYRNSRNNKLLREKIIQREAVLSEEERKLKDQEIERKIFAQRKLMTKLSLPAKHFSSEVQSNQNVSQPIVKRRAKVGQPRLSSNALTFHHIMRKSAVPIPTPATSLATVDEEEVENRKDEISLKFEEMRRLKEAREESKYTFQPTILTPLPTQSKKVSTKDYTADHLLHSWHRDMNRLRSLIHRDGPIKSKTLTDVTDENERGDDEEEDEGEDNSDELGWNPFVLK